MNDPRTKPDQQAPPPPPTSPSAPTPPPATTIPPETPTDFADISRPLPNAPEDIRNTLVIKEGDFFLITNLDGNAPPGDLNGLGLYHQDTRFLSTYELKFEKLTPIYLLSTGELRFAQTQELTNPDLPLPNQPLISKDTLTIHRTRVITNTVEEEINITNLNIFPVELELTMSFDADFKDIFQVRGLQVKETLGRHYPPEVTSDHLIFRYIGVDNMARATSISFAPAPASLTDHTARYRIRLDPRQTDSLHLSISIAMEPVEKVGKARAEPEGHEIPPPFPRAFPLRLAPGPAVARPATTELIRQGQQSYRAWLDARTCIDSSNQFWNDVVERARLDLRMMLNGTGTGPDGGAEQNVENWYPVAGIPWFASLFGRDSLIVGIQMPWDPSFARATLHRLANLQGATDDPWRDEQPGKILHEFRHGELSRANLIPFNPYYGTVDATPLFVLLVSTYYQRTADLELVRQLEPNLRKALDWMRDYGDVDGDGFIEYQRQSSAGLVNQGWKDSWDAITYADGSLVEPPIALVEVQAYAYAARLGAAKLYRALDRPNEASRLEYEAAWLRDAFNRAFWMPEENFYCLALDGKKRQAKVISSNPGHALWCGILPPERGLLVAQRLFKPDIFSGWGIRTLSTREVRYNPIGYHIGTVWPHDNSLIAMGLKRYGQDDGLLKIVTGLFRSSRHFPDQRIPELFCGYDDQSYPIPVRYPVACSPQAWASGAPLYLLQAMLGLDFHAPDHELRIVRPVLPDWLRSVTLERIPVGDARIDLRYRVEGGHTYTEVLGVEGDAHVTFYEKWQD